MQFHTILSRFDVFHSDKYPGTHSGTSNWSTMRDYWSRDDGDGDDGDDSDDGDDDGGPMDQQGLHLKPLNL